ncbi:MAG: DUF4339 domain-containing protein [Akkermansiaceae bacterium]|nr:DUF4339 domain-containing protein [Akkermansiaceae bacterium]
MSNVQWFYSDVQQQQQGPLTFDQIQQMAATGEIQPNTLIWNENLPSWTAASSVPGVFNSAGQTAPSPYPAPAVGQVAPTGGHYPTPQVKKTSFALWIGTYLASLILIGIAMAAVIAAAPAAPDYSEENRKMSQAETEQEIREAQEAMNRKTEEYTREFSGESVAGMGAGALGLFLGWALSVFAAVYAYIILYRAWLILQPGGARTTPGKAVGFCFIPFFNIYWIFNVYVGWATDWTRIRSSYSNLQNAPQASSGLFIASVVCLITVILMPIGIILFMICKKQMCDTINHCAANPNGGMTGSF